MSSIMAVVLSVLVHSLLRKACRTAFSAGQQVWRQEQSFRLGRALANFCSHILGVSMNEDLLPYVHSVDSFPSRYLKKGKRRFKRWQKANKLHFDYHSLLWLSALEIRGIADVFVNVA